MSAASFSACSSRTSAMMTLAPRSAKSRASASPWPREPPVIRATLPVRSVMEFSVRGCGWLQWAWLLRCGECTENVLCGSESRLHGGFGVPGAEEVAREHDAAAAAGEGGLQLAAAGEAVRQAVMPTLNMGFFDEAGEAREDLVEVAVVGVEDLGV